MNAERTDRQTPAGIGPGVTVRYWAGARAAAGVESETLPAGSAALVVAEAVARHPQLAAVADLCAVLVDGSRVEPEAPVPAGAVVELLPPFAGG